MGKEKWKWVPGFLGRYKISDHGRLLSVTRFVEIKGFFHKRVGRVLRTMADPRTGHRWICLYKNDAKTVFYVHTLVLTAFVGPRPSPKHQCRHFPDRDPSNNRLDNLRWGTFKENWADMLVHGTAPVGECHSQAKLTASKVRYIREFYKRRDPVWGGAALARKFGVTSSLISYIVGGKIWKAVK